MASTPASTKPHKKCWGRLILGCWQSMVLGKSLQWTWDIYIALLHLKNLSCCRGFSIALCCCEHLCKKHTDMLSQSSMEDNNIENRRLLIPVRLHMSSSSVSLSPVNVTALSTCRYTDHEAIYKGPFDRIHYESHKRSAKSVPFCRLSALFMWEDNHTNVFVWGAKSWLHC